MPRQRPETAQPVPALWTPSDEEQRLMKKLRRYCQHDLTQYDHLLTLCVEKPDALAQRLRTLLSRMEQGTLVYDPRAPSLEGLLAKQAAPGPNRATVRAQRRRRT